MKLAIKIEQLSKQYRLGNIGTGTISHDLNRLWAKLSGKEDPFLKVGEKNNRANKGSSDYVWALQNIDLEVKEGDILGIIGRNGAGKSTLLKILSKVTRPTTGSIKTRGRIASLLEVGTGFHPELTGRENIFLNGAILGMNKAEIKGKLDEIVDFAGVTRYIDTPVKRYSSGMMVRLGFAVAAHLEQEILVVDEVLAVGDAEFQKKAIGKMQDVSSNQGRTVLFVSHNLASVKSLCNSGIVLEEGTIGYAGSVDDSIQYYLNNENNSGHLNGMTRWKTEEAPGSSGFKLLSVATANESGEIRHSFSNTEPVYVKIETELEEVLRNMRLNLKLFSSDGILLFTISSHKYEDHSKDPGKYNYSFSIPGKFLNHGTYSIQLQGGMPGIAQILSETIVARFSIEKVSDSGTKLSTVLPGVTAPEISWTIEKNSQ